MELQPNDFLNGITCIISVVISYALIIEMIRKSHEHKNKMLMYIGISTFGLVSLYNGTVASFVWQLFSQYPFPQELYLILGTCITPFSMSCWMYVVLTISNRKRVKLFVVLVFILMISLFIILVYLVFNNIDLVGEKLPGSNIDIRFENFGLFYSIMSLTLFWIGTAFFLGNIFKSNSPELKLKGILISLAMITFLSSAILDGWFELEPIPLIIARIFIIIASIESYIGWIMPEFVKKIFLKNWMKESSLNNFSVTLAKENKPNNHDIQHILKLLSSKPKKITEQEVHFFHEQKICLVCKGKVVKYNFICKCDALYCIKCVEALIELENLCWVCNEPLDDSKTVKKIEVGDYDNIVGKEEDNLKKK
ncbi:MAG: hypothetical protein ACFFBP_05040 [Promethearchaeota archaeon]